MASKDANEELQNESAKSKTNKTTKKKTKPVLGRKKKEDKLKEELETLNQELAEAKDKYLRLFAEFDNFKKRTIKEKLELMSTAAQNTIVDLLPVLDDFDRAESVGEAFSEGVNMVRHKLLNSLKSKGLKEMDTTGETFDSELHEAITEIPAPTPDLKQKVVDTIEKGYYLNDKIIRFAKVIVGK